MPKETQDFYKTGVVCQMTGLTKRQLQWWDEQGIVVPIRQGWNRMYSASQVERIKKVAKLRKAGVSLQKISIFLRLKTEWNAVVAVRKPTIINGTLYVPIPG